MSDDTERPATGTVAWARWFADRLREAYDRCPVSDETARTVLHAKWGTANFMAEKLEQFDGDA